MQGFVFAIILLTIFALLVTSARKERFGTVLGAAGPYAAHYNKCINSCNKADPNNRFLASGNINCGNYCSELIEEFVRDGIDPDSISLESECDLKCKNYTGSDEIYCKDKCHGDTQIAQWCKELWCPYSKMPEDQCMGQCIAVNGVRNNQNSWTWDFEK